MATKEQILNACDDVMKQQIKELLYKFWCANCWGSDRTMEETLNHYTEIFFKLADKEPKNICNCKQKMLYYCPVCGGNIKKGDL